MTKQTNLEAKVEASKKETLTVL